MNRKIKPLQMNRLGDQRGAVIALVAILMIVVVGLSALAIDVSHLFVVKNELQNAADAGALAGARVLYNDEGTSINTGANQEAFNAARANLALSTAGAIAVDVNWTSGNTGDIQRGHWSFDPPEGQDPFTPSDSTTVIDLWGVSTEDLDKMDGVRYVALDGSRPVFINAVKVIARRDATRASSFFARIFGFDDFALSSEAVAYLGFAGTINPHDVDLPVAICEESILKDGKYSCEYGRMLNSGQNPQNIDDHNTGGWTDFSVQTICNGTNTNDMRDVLEGCQGNPATIQLGSFIGTTGGVADNLIDHEGKGKADVFACWMSALYDSNGDHIKDSPIDTDHDGWPDQPWNVNLPVIECPGNNVATCSKFVGSVNVDIVWILEQANDINTDAPYKMGNWSNNNPDGITRWNSFVNAFGLRTVSGDPATYENGGFKKKSLYFLPDCTRNKPTGVTGGENFGVLAEIPVLVK